jgi:hypothetical protein
VWCGGCGGEIERSVVTVMVVAGDGGGGRRPERKREWSVAELEKISRVGQQNIL